MNDPKTRFFLLGAAVIVMGVMLGTMLWLKLGPPTAAVACGWHWQ